MTTSSYPLPRQTNIFPQILAALLGGLLLFFLSIAAATSGYQFYYAGHIFPGVSVASVDISVLTPEEAALRLNQNLTYPYAGQILFRDGEKAWLAAPAQLGMVFDVGASVQSAYRVGRSGGLFGSLAAQMNSRRGGVDVSPVILFDQRVAYDYLQSIAAQIDKPVVESSLTIQGAQVSDTLGQVGRLLNVDTTLLNLTAQLQSFRDGEVPLVVEDQAPQILDASAAAATARQILSAPLTLGFPDMQSGDPGPWVVDVQTLANMLLVTRAVSLTVPSVSGEQYRISLDATVLQPFLEGIAASLDRGFEDARFTFNDDTRQLDLIQPAVTGRKLDVEATLAAIQEKALQGEHNIPLALIYTQPAVGSDATAESLGITGLVSEESTYFRGSSSERIQNIQAASARFHGLLIAPGETFSMAEALGDISLENGFAEALIISNGRTIKGVGGGVCQVSTTLFRTVFFGGYPIVERYPHAYRVGYYEQSAYSYDSNMAGLDATVFVPLVDFKFTNDTPYWLLMETYVNVGARRLTWKFYSTKDGRTYEWITTGPQDVVPAPDPLFQENSDLEPGEMKQVDWSADGANVTVTRIVWRGGQVLYDDTISTHYTAWQAVCEYGPGTVNPESLAQELGLCQQ
ncbi:MAG: VanW family protein [Anaerolineales bacterium]|nr:VanW family protein [Anaerolineales bacterium]